MGHNILEKKARELHRYANRVLPKQAKDLGLQFFKSRFRAQGWLDASFKPWAKRKRADKKRPGRAILMDRGKLRNSIRADINGANIIFGTDVPYAKAHNEGATITIGAGNRIIAHKKYTRGKRKGKVLFAKNNKEATFAKKVAVKTRAIKMPQRQFMGESAHLNRVITRKIDSELKKIFK